MKKILVIVSMLIVAAACSAPPTNREASPANANVATAPAAAAMTEAEAIAKEKAIWETIKNKDYEAFANMLDEDQVEVMGAAVHDKAGSIATVKDFEPSEVTFSDWRYLSIDKDAFVIIYTASVKGKFKGKEFPPESDRCSSAWVNRNGKWLAKYHQECPVKPAMQTAGNASKANTNSAAKAGSSPAASHTMATGADPIANEKMVWDMFKSKDYDGFAAVLAPDFLEVEPDKVYDKAESVKGVSLFDASKAVLSDWKATNIDADAALVTYLAKIPGAPPEGERHSTIWANRDGKWLALFHHGGTPVMKPGAMAAPKASASPSPTLAATPATKASPATKPPIKRP